MRAPRRLLVVTQWSYRDALIQTYTLPYVRLILKELPEGSRVHLVTQEQERLRLAPEEAARERAALRDEGIDWLPTDYTRFGVTAMARAGLTLARLGALCVVGEVDVVHAWCTTAGTLGYVLSAATGKPLVIDSFEPHAESMVENGTWRSGGLAHRVLSFFERRQARRARAVIATTEGMLGYARERWGAVPPAAFVKPSCIDADAFAARATDVEALRDELGLRGKLVAVYAGKIGGIYLEREIFDLLRAAHDRWGDRLRVLLLSGSPRAEVDRLCAEAGLPPEVVTLRFVAHADVPRHLALGDFAINPVRPVPTKRFCTSIKDGEYWAMGLPVVIPEGISDDSAIVERRRIGVVLRAFTPEGYRRCVAELAALLDEDREALRRRVREAVVAHRSFSVAEAAYRALYGEGGLLSPEAEIADK